MTMFAALLIVVTSSPAADIDRHWIFTPDTEARRFSMTADTEPIAGAGPWAYTDAEVGAGLILDGASGVMTIGATRHDLTTPLPARELTVGAWVSIDVPQRWGGIVGCVQDNGDAEQGWVLGYDESRFTFALASDGADDGDGQLTYLAVDAGAYEVGRWHHVVATYDGSTMDLYLDGAHVATSDQQHGEILYDDAAPFVIGAYKDDNEQFIHDGRLREVRVVDVAMSPQLIASWHAQQRDLNERAPWVDTIADWLVLPFLTWPTQTQMSVNFETTVPTAATVTWWHESGEPRGTVPRTAKQMLHTVRLADLQPNEKYFYQVSAVGIDGTQIDSDVLSFRTAVSEDRSFTFVAIGDTQSQPEVVKRVSDLAFMHRPNLVVHAGDLVSTGSVKSDWTTHFFPNMQPLIGRVPLMPVLGNHEQDADHYYKYMDLPAPEYSYAFRFGNAEFFMIDGNRELGHGTQQLQWLEATLSKSTARWRFAVLHQPPYTSDSDDYGDTFKGTSTRGDTNVQNIIGLLEKYGVDICFSGHVHDYERTHPIRGGRTMSWEDGGVIYVTAAGGGGHLENFDPANTWFGHKKAQYHHLVYVSVNGDELEFQAIDEHGGLFDVMTLKKSDARRDRVEHGELHEDGHDH